MRGTIQERFFDKVEMLPDAPGCWLWGGALSGPGKPEEQYGKLSVGSKSLGMVYAHRLSWEIHRGHIPLGLFVLHKCDLGPCVNPEHLFLGTQADNMKDKVRKNRQAKGEVQGPSKLTDREIREIRAQHRFGESQSSIAKAFGISLTTANRIVRGKLWKHVN